MLRTRRRAAPALAASIALLVLAGGGTAGADIAAKTPKSCQLLKPEEITSAFGMEAGRGTQQGPDCTWQVGELPLSLETVTKDAKATYESLRDLAADAGAEPVKVKVPRGRAVFAEITSFKELLVLKGKTFLFLRLLDIENTVDAATAQTAMTQLGKQALKRV
jgi:nucleotide-binding universal stress UspA family protein